MSTNAYRLPISPIDKDLLKVFEATPVAMILSRHDGSFEYVNQALLNMLGYTEEEVYSDSVIISHPDDTPLNTHIRRHLQLDPFTPITVEKRYLHKSGRTIYGMLSIVAQANDRGKVERFIAQIVDITAHKKAEGELQLLSTLVNKSSEGMFVIEPETGKVVGVNGQACKDLGYSREELLKLEVSAVEVGIKNLDEWLRQVRALQVLGNKTTKGNHRRKDGSIYAVEVNASYILQNDKAYVLAMVRDITERNKTEALIRKQANFDTLTGLPNRNMLYDRLQQTIQRAERSAERIAVLSLDLDKFKDINDTLGHDVGDLLLVAAGERISACVRKADTVARLGGDEFSIIVSVTDDADHLDRICRCILASLAEPFELGVNQGFVSASIGITLYPDDGSTVESLLKNADQAMYVAKHNGRNGFQYFTHTMQQEAVTRIQLNADLRGAIAAEQFHVVYQPIVDLKTGKVNKAEALIRWCHPSKGVISPERFIPIAEESGIIVQIGEWMFTQVAKQVKYWRDRYIPDFSVTINTSPVQFRDSSNQLIGWSQYLTEFGLGGDAIIVEITEGMMMDSGEEVTDKLLLLRDANIQVALDDFGTGYSSLSYLKKFDIDYLKIDQSFVRNLHSDSEDVALCEAIIVMAHKLRLQVIAEGIETEEQLKFLVNANCDYGQGYLFSEALPSRQFEKLLSKASLS